MTGEGGGVKVKGEGWWMREEGWKIKCKGGGEGGGSELGSDLDLDPNPDPWKILWIRIRQNDADPLGSDPDPQQCYFWNSHHPAEGKC